MIGLFLLFVLSSAGFVIVWRLQTDTPEERKYRRIREAERKAIAQFWKDRGKVIKPRIHRSEWDVEIHY